MTAATWFNALPDAIEMAHHLMQCTTRAQAEGFYGRMMTRYRANKGAEHADSVAVQMDALLAGVDAMRKGVVS